LLNFFRTFKPDFLLVRQNLRDANEDYRGLLLGFQYGEVPSVNTLESIYNFQVWNVTFRHFRTQYWDKKIKRHFDCNDISKYLELSQKNIFNIHRKQNIGWKMYFYLNIFLSQYCVQKCLVCIGPNAYILIPDEIIGNLWQQWKVLCFDRQFIPEFDFTKYHHLRIIQKVSKMLLLLCCDAHLNVDKKNA